MSLPDTAAAPQRAIRQYFVKMLLHLSLSKLIARQFVSGKPIRTGFPPHSAAES